MADAAGRNPTAGRLLVGAVLLVDTALLVVGALVVDTGAMVALRHLLLVRHAKAQPVQPAAPDRRDDLADHERPLSARGRRDAPEIGRWVARQVGPIDLVLCSSAVRAVQTWELASSALAVPPAVDVRPSLYLAEPGRVLAAVREVGDDVRNLVVVGHEPAQSALTLGLADDGSDPDALQLVDEGFVTSGVALLEVDGPWSALQVQGARLVAFTAARGQR